jgi:hypothetical protein
MASIVLILSLIPGISISLVGEKIHCLGFGFTSAKKNVFDFVFFFNTGKYLVYQRRFWWDEPSETI